LIGNAINKHFSAMYVMNNLLLQNLIELIARHTGLHTREQDKQILRQKITTRIQALNLSTAEQYYQLLDTNINAGSIETSGDREWKELTLLLTTGESYFFRDKGQIALLKNRLLPQIIEQKKRASTQHNSQKLSLRIWSAGCSSGEEVYSIAVLVKELIPDLHNWNILILGTDINLEAIAKAKRGLYDSWSFRMVEPEIIHRYFKPRQQSWEVKESICSMVKFQLGNLIKDNFPQPHIDIHSMDIIICRNVFIYFDACSISMVLNKFYHTLNNSGYLVTGHAELHGQDLGKLQTRVFPESLVYQRSEGSSLDKHIIPAQSLPTLVNINRKENILKPQEVKRLKPKIENDIPAQSPKLLASIATAETLFHQGEYPAAIQEAEQVIKQQPLHFDACYLLAQAWANLGKAERAAFYCQQAIEIDPLSTHAYYLLAHIAEEKGDTSNAKKLLRKIIYLVPVSIDAYLELGDIYQREGDMTKAKKMRTTAWDLLNQLPSNFMVEPSRNTVSELTVQVSNLLQNHP
jgi:chemotaxis protein methyltransferase CheR